MLVDPAEISGTHIDLSRHGIHVQIFELQFFGKPNVKIWKHVAVSHL